MKHITFFVLTILLNTALAQTKDTIVVLKEWQTRRLIELNLKMAEVQEELDFYVNSIAPKVDSVKLKGYDAGKLIFTIPQPKRKKK